MVPNLTYPFGPDTPEDVIVAWVDRTESNDKCRQSLARLLCERASVYRGRGANQTARLRGYILAACGRVGLHETALPIVLEELESGCEAYVVAAAARALRGYHSNEARFANILLRAIRNIRYDDDCFTFDTYQPRWPLERSTTAMEEVFKTMTWLGPNAGNTVSELKRLTTEQRGFSQKVREQLQGAINAVSTVHRKSCCAQPMSIRAGVRVVDSTHSFREIADLVVQDQEGDEYTFGDLVPGGPSVVTFFYTRCENPMKCSTTISKLGQLQKKLAAAGMNDQVKLFAFTYDPLYDFPRRLRHYGEHRGVEFGSNLRLLRTPSGIERLRSWFELGVGFGPAVVNRHRIELFILDSDGRVTAEVTRVQWDVDEVCTQIMNMVDAS